MQSEKNSVQVISTTILRYKVMYTLICVKVKYTNINRTYLWMIGFRMLAIFLFSVFPTTNMQTFITRKKRIIFKNNYCYFKSEVWL